jgi:hypothetical protein
MIRDVGLWIDDRKAVIVMIEYPDSQVQFAQANLKKHVQFSWGGALDKIPEDIRARKDKHHLTYYYGEVVAWIRDADSIQIFGPGNEKLDLEARLKQEELGSRIVGVETAQKMSDRQIEAKIWQYFLARK